MLPPVGLQVYVYGDTPPETTMLADPFEFPQVAAVLDVTVVMALG